MAAREQGDVHRDRGCIIVALYRSRALRGVHTVADADEARCATNLLLLARYYGASAQVSTVPLAPPEAPPRLLGAHAAAAFDAASPRCTGRSGALRTLRSPLEDGEPVPSAHRPASGPAADP